LVALSFDDGFLDFYDVALPILSGFGFRATLYVPTAFIGKSAAWVPRSDSQLRTLSWGQLRDCAAAGTEIGSHGVNHIPLDVLSPRQAMTELVGSRQQLEDNLGLPVRSLAYPHGYASPRLARAVREAGYSSACVIGHRPWRTDRPRTAISRILVRPESGSRRPSFDPPAVVLIEGMLKQLATPSWRLARRAGGSVRPPVPRNRGHGDHDPSSLSGGPEVVR
jgi:peptidoglycan/xylan/chitin deacetylase (PgdA/CDA1 family)